MDLQTEIQQLLSQGNPFEKDVGEIQIAPREIRHVVINLLEQSSLDEQHKIEISQFAVNAASELGQPVPEGAGVFGIREVRISRIALALLLAGIIGLATGVLTPSNVGDLLKQVIASTNATACSMVACYRVFFSRRKKISTDEQAIFANIRAGIAHYGSLRHPAPPEQDIYRRISKTCKKPRDMVNKLCRSGLIENITTSIQEEYYVLQEDIENE